MELQEDIDENLEEVEKLFLKLKRCQMARVKTFKFSNSGNDDEESKQKSREIASISSEITTLIKKSEKQLKSLVDFSSNDEKIDRDIRKNI